MSCLGGLCPNIPNCKSNMLLSFIIPTYNCGRYIDCCLESILAQELDKDDYEVIVVNDGSTDDTEEKVKKYCVKNENIRLISIPNSGAGNARNIGIKYAHGQYVYFIDADDWLLPGGMKILFDCYVIPKCFPDVVSFYSHTVDKHYCAKEWDVIHPHSALFKGTLIECAKKRGVANSVWSHLISRDLITSKQLEFSDHKIGEDMLFMLNLYGIESATILATSLNIYRYNVRDDSAMNNTRKEYILNVFKSLIDISDRLKEFKTNTVLPSFVLDADINLCKRWAFTRLSSVALTYNEIRKYLKTADSRMLFCMGESRSAINLLIWIISRNPAIFCVFSVGYRKFFLPFIKPYLKRN